MGGRIVSAEEYVKEVREWKRPTIHLESLDL